LGHFYTPLQLLEMLPFQHIMTPLCFGHVDVLGETGLGRKIVDAFLHSGTMSVCLFLHLFSFPRDIQGVNLHWITYSTTAALL